MKKGFLIFLIICSYFTANSQVNKPKKKEVPVKLKDTVKTEVVEIVTKYNPKISDATKIKINPVIQLSENTKKKKLAYTIFSAPVASTFIPKSGVVKGIDVGVKERIYNNYVAAGFGNYTSPYTEIYLHNSNRFESEFGLSAKYNASFDNIENTVLDSNFENFIASIFYKKEGRYFDWKTVLNTKRSQYNWYGLPSLDFNENTINTINEEQTYNYFNVLGEIDFLDSYIDKSSLSLSYFNDRFNSNEILINLNTALDLPLDFISNSLKNMYLKTSLEFLTGGFTSNYTGDNELNYSIFTAGLNPEYKTTFGGFSIKLGAKIFGSFDTENSINNFLIYPDIKIETPIIKDYLNFYAGINGDLKTNTYKNFSEENPYVSPTLFMTQTSEKYNVFTGVNGTIDNSFSFNISANIKEEQDKPLFIKNNSKSTGTNTTLNSISLKGYEFGNSFNVVYDDIKTTTLFAELEYDFTKKITVGTSLQYDNYTTTNQFEAWNLPTFQTSLIGKFKSDKWYATTNVFYVSERKDVLYTDQFPSTSNGIQTVNSFVDINLNGGYHFSDKFSSFLKLNNILNSNYERFANFNVQGFQVLGGLTYKFDF
ncbi:hypothetical protein [uncultured Polaribacter sp.]|uniref:hypothetical protein n=1 Tax=uncultured Polaribacter sp. TaxID=174711 RepID=UPI0026389716|nr:hypothetical protein [uncultured Polaribacter sp.]